MYEQEDDMADRNGCGTDRAGRQGLDPDAVGPVIGSAAGQDAQAAPAAPSPVAADLAAAVDDFGQAGWLLSKLAAALARSIQPDEVCPAAAVVVRRDAACARAAAETAARLVFALHAQVAARPAAQETK
jgi:hypothetical protein